MEVLMAVVGAIVQAMVTGSWPWMRQQVITLLGRGNRARGEAVAAELDRAQGSLSSSSGEARPLVESDIRGLLARQLLTDPGFAADLLKLHRKIQTEYPTLLVNAAGRDSFFANGNLTVYTGSGAPAETFPSADRLAGMAAEEAVRLLDGAEPGIARDRLMAMEIQPAVDRLALMDRERAVYLLSYLDGERAAKVLKRFGAQLTREFLLLMLPARSGIILQYAPPTWVLERLAALPTTRALAILAAMPQPRRVAVVHVMEHRQALALLSAVGELMAENQLPFQEAQREAERILADARTEAASILAFANEQAAKIRPEDTEVDVPTGPSGAEPSPAPLSSATAELRDLIRRFLKEHPGSSYTPQEVAHALGRNRGDVATALAQLAANGEINGGGRAKRYSWPSGLL
jgi:hypothetical protein